MSLIFRAADDRSDRNLIAVIAEELLKIIEEDAVPGGTRMQVAERCGDASEIPHPGRNHQDMTCLPFPAYEHEE